MKITLSGNNKKLNFGYVVFQIPKTAFLNPNNETAVTEQFISKVNSEFERIHPPSSIKKLLPLLAPKEIKPTTFLNYCGYRPLQEISDEGKLWLKENSLKLGINFPFREEIDNENYKFIILDKDENALYLKLSKCNKKFAKVIRTFNNNIAKWNLEHENEIDNIKERWLRKAVLANLYQDLFNSRIGTKPPVTTYIVKSLKELQGDLSEALTVLKWKK